ncbi:Golgi apparatus membrane protein TVP38 [Vararia minispora EC-137]|uniref:Golgi apparatus membrane protein TVP38 n=1 Tax=Vararia minispora EC-137 TaxID=1314806 RepID=A0ACB8QWY3_9AGAM|nr:Golgi apparatus membrane protein TVP38 [Vararia minispora EC-137]
MTSDEGLPNPRGSVFARLAERYIVGTGRRIKNMPLVAKFFVLSLALFYSALLTLVVIITPARIGQFLYDTAQKISGHPLGWLLLTAMFFVVSIPPMTGHTTMLNLCGFAYGMKGCLIGGPASLIASASVFVMLRFFFSGRLAKWSATNKHWQALESVINTKGLPLMCLIRISPVPPWVYSISLFASIRTVSVWQFMIATLCSFPRYFLYIFIGSRLAVLSDGETRDKMDPTAKVVNWLLVGFGFVIAGVASWILYVLMQRELKKLEPSASEAILEADEGAPLLEDDEV